MSGKIRSKDLAYDAALPPFLQRLRAQNLGQGDGDRHERPIPRPRLAKDANDEDGPTVVDETGETITQHDFEKRAAVAAVAGDANKDADDKPAASAGIEGLPTKRPEQRVTDGTTSKKRKAVKIVADEDPAPEGRSKGPDETIKKAKKTSKPIKLAFEDNGEDG